MGKKSAVGVAGPKAGAAPVDEWPSAAAVAGLSKAGPWSEPSEPPGVNGHLDLDVPETRVENLLLRANVPSTITLRGPADLAFENVTVVLTAKTLVRNLAQPRWGTKPDAVTTPIRGTQFTLALPARMEAVGIKRPFTLRQRTFPAVAVQIREPAGWSSLIADMPLERFAGQEGVSGRTPRRESLPGWESAMQADGADGRGSDWLSGLVSQSFETDAVVVGAAGSALSVLLRSPSLPSRVAVAVGDDSPVQLFPNQMVEGGTLTTRDLTPQLSAAWTAAASAAGGAAETPGATPVEVKLRLTSQTDGVVSVALAGTWGELYETGLTEIAVNALEPMGLKLNYPLAGTDAEARLRLYGELTGGRRMGLTTGPPEYVVRVTERLEAAQAVLLAKQAGTAAARQVSAVWLLLPRVPAAPAELELRLAGIAGDPSVPADEVLVRTRLTLPADESAYRMTDQGAWFRAAFAKPIPLDGAQVRRPLFVVAAGRGEGVRLCHRSNGSLPPDSRAGRLPVDAGRAGTALVRNLERSGSWELQSFNRRAAVWIMDLELLPLPSESQGLVTVTFPGGQPQEAGFMGTGESQVTGRLASLHSGAAMRVDLQSQVAGKLAWQLQVRRPIKT